jgi:hypothetical protein
MCLDSQPFLDDRGVPATPVASWNEAAPDCPCPRCGATAGCEASGDGRFVRCRLVVSAHPIVGGGWYHPIPVGVA